MAYLRRPRGSDLGGLVGGDLDGEAPVLDATQWTLAGKKTLATSSTAYRDILRASAAFLREVYITRWVHPRQSGQ